jgi:hypothetical protein
VAAAHARLLKDASIQFHPYVDRAPAVLSLLRVLAPLLKALGPFGGWIVFGGLIIALGALFYPLVQRLLQSSPSKPSSVNLTGALAPPSRARARALLEEADRLAAEGQFGEAARILLARSIQDVEAQRPKSIPKSATAREIARLPVLTEDARVCFSGIASAAESFAFAGKPMDQSTFDRCRTLYADFALPTVWSTANPRTRGGGADGVSAP